MVPGMVPGMQSPNRHYKDCSAETDVCIHAGLRESGFIAKYKAGCVSISSIGLVLRGTQDQSIHNKKVSFAQGLHLRTFPPRL